MTQRPQSDVFVVQGTGEFPHDMLRRDYASANTPEDQSKIDETYQDNSSCRLRRVTLRTRERDVTEGRWESYGWPVIVPLPEWSPHRGYSGLPPVERTMPDPRYDVVIRVTCPNATVAHHVRDTMVAAATTGRDVVVADNVVERHIGQ